MAKSRRLSATRMLVELIENGIEAERQKQQAAADAEDRSAAGLFGAVRRHLAQERTVDRVALVTEPRA